MPKKPTQSKIDKARVRVSDTPVWGGPEDDGITQSLINSYLACRERFRVKTIDGLQAVDKFNIPLGYGDLWHIAEESHAADEDYEKAVRDATRVYCKRYKLEQETILKWCQVCLIQFPIYVEYWKKHEDVVNRKPIYQEVSFEVEHRLPSGRMVRLRGKWDSVDEIKGRGIYLQENKTKSKVDVQSLERQLCYDLQVMTYIIALRENLGKEIKGVRYNVIRRALSGGVGTIRPHKATKTKPAETMENYWSRLHDVIVENQDTFFHRWSVDIEKYEVNRFQRETLDPILENICDDYEWWSHCKKQGTDPYDSETRYRLFGDHCPRHFRLPYGTYSVVAQGGFDDVDDYLNTGNKVGLQKVTDLFPELD
jgi:hypothetical protein